MKLYFILLILTFSIHANAWDRFNDPSKILGKGYEQKFNKLPLKGQSGELPWSGYQWPDQNGGIAFRWQIEHNKLPFDYKLLSREEVTNLSQEDLNKMSPAEKYDVLMNNYDYPTVKSEIKRTDIDFPDWYGLCHAQALAATLYDEPKSKTFNLDADFNGKTLTFYPSDIKALLLFNIHHSKFFRLGLYKTVGQRCRSKEADSPACRDINPASFHLLITNMIGIKKKALPIDFGHNFSVWNHATYAFNSEVIEEKKNRIHLKTTINRAVRLEHPQKKQAGVVNRPKVYEYILELDKRGRIIKGRWLSDEHPDFVWTMQRPPMGGYYYKVNSMVKGRRN